MELPENSISLRVGGTIGLRWLAMLAVIHRFRWYFLVAIALWMAVGAYFGEATLHAEVTALLLLPVVCNVLGVDPGQLIMRGTVTFSPDDVYWTNVWGRTKSRGWGWVRKAEDVRGNLHIVFGRHRTRAVAIRSQLSISTFYGLRELLIIQGKLAT